MNQTTMDSEVNTIEVLLAQITGDLKGNAKLVQARRLFGFVGGNPNDGTFGRQFTIL